MKVVVSGIPRGYHFARSDGNWLTERHREQIESVPGDIHLVEIPPERVRDADLDGTEVVLAEGGNRTHYPGELDYEDYQRLFVPSVKWVQLCSTGFGDNVNRHILDGSVILTNAPGLHTQAIAESVLVAREEIRAASAGPSRANLVAEKVRRTVREEGAQEPVPSDVASEAI